MTFDNTAIPASMECPDEARDWWEKLTVQERIIRALEAAKEIGSLDEPTYVAEKPWKWAAEAYTHTLSEPNGG